MFEFCSKYFKKCLDLKDNLYCLNGRPKVQIREYKDAGKWIFKGNGE